MANERMATQCVQLALQSLHEALSLAQRSNSSGIHNTANVIIVVVVDIWLGAIVALARSRCNGLLECLLSVQTCIE